MDHRILILGALLLLIGGCAQEPLIEQPDKAFDAYALATHNSNNMGELDFETQNMQNPFLKGKAVEKPIKLRSSGMTEYRMYSNDCNGLIQAVIFGKGIASHVGNFSVGLAIALLKILLFLREMCLKPSPLPTGIRSTLN